MNVTTERAVSVVIRHPDEEQRVLGILRPDDPEDPLRGLWGLPATTLSPGESEMDALTRLVHAKLGMGMLGTRLLRSGSQKRADRLLAMTLYEADTDDQLPRLPEPCQQKAGRTYYAEWRWVSPEKLIEASAKGSLCTQLFLAHEGIRIR